MAQHWELVAAGRTGAAIEQLNLAALDAAVEALIRARLARRPGAARIPDETDLRHLHSIATYGLLARPGAYRRADVHLQDADGYAVRRAAPARQVRPLLRGFLRELRRSWKRSDALDVAALCLWQITFIHPFPNGNGRAAMAFGYACVCIKLGKVLPGAPTMLQQQTADSRPSYPYFHAPNDEHKRTGGRPDLTGLKTYLDGLLLRQMKTARRSTRTRRFRSR